MKEFRAEGELPGDVGLKIRRAVNRTAGGEEQMLVFGEINNGSHIERRVVAPAILHGGAVINFAADEDVVPHLILEHHAAKFPVMVACARIDAVAAAAVSRPLAETFLDPQRQECLPFAAAQAARAVAGRGFDQGENAGLRERGRLLEKPEFDAQFGVAVTVLRIAVFRGVVGQRRDEVELHVGDDAVIDFEVRGSAGPAARCLGVLGGDVEFPMLIIHRFGVVGEKRRAGAEPGGYE